MGLGWKVWAGVGYGLFLVILGIVITVYKWSLWVLFAAVIIPSGMVLGSMGVSKFRDVEVEKKPESVELMDIEEWKKYIEDYVVVRKRAAPVDMIEEFISAQYYIPRQEGEDKRTVFKAKMKGLFGANMYGFDILCVAFDAQSKKHIVEEQYGLDDDDVDERFNEKISDSVSNPEKIRRLRTEVIDASGHRTIQERLEPAEYIEKARSAAQAKKDEEEEGVEN